MEILLNFWPIGAGSLKWGRLAGFYEVSIDFYNTKMAQKIFYDLLRPIPTYTEGPQILKKNCNCPIPHADSQSTIHKETMYESLKYNWYPKHTFEITFFTTIL